MSILLSIAASTAYAQMECRCHSKQPAMRRMHESIGFSNCVPCHDSNGLVKKGIDSNSRIMGISDTLYCPKDKARFSPGAKACSKCGGPLLDINALMAQSRMKPSNEICSMCHLTGEVQQIKQHAVLKPGMLNQCLACHKGHNDCESCHH